MACTDDAPQFNYDDRLNEFSPWKPWFLPHIPLDSGSSLSRGVLALESSMVFSGSIDQAGLDFCDSGDGHGIPINFASTMMSPRFAAPYEPSGTHLPLVGVRSYASLPLFAGSSNDFSETDTPYRSLALDMTSKPQAAQQTSALIPGFSSSTRYHTNTNIELDPTASPKNSMLVSSSCRSSEEGANSVDDEMQIPIMLYRPPEKKGSCRRRFQRACAINIEGLWIDKDDLYPGAGQGSGTISVHECQWAKSSDPCGMWIIGSRSHFGAHIRKWHTQSHTDSTAQCLWEGCATSKAMLRDSISRHVVTVHLGEGFHCRGCNQEFSRKDVYGKHVRKRELCRGIGVATVYGTERRVVDTRQALRRGGTIRFGD